MSLTFTQNITLHIHNMPIQPYRHVLKALENKQTHTNARVQHSACALLLAFDARGRRAPVLPSPPCILLCNVYHASCDIISLVYAEKRQCERHSKLM